MAANNKYDAEYIRYFAGVDALYIPSYCGYASKAQYSPVKGKPRPPCYNDPTSTLSPLPSTSTLYPYPLPLPSTPTLYPLPPLPLPSTPLPVAGKSVLFARNHNNPRAIFAGAHAAARRAG